MGSVRGRLNRGGCVATVFVFAILLPARARADVCEDLRPDWSPADGPITRLASALDLLTSLPGLVLLAIVLAAWVLRRRDMAVAGALLAVVYLVTLYAVQLDPTHIRSRGIAEGCLGPPELAYVVLAFVILAALSAALRRSGPRR